MGIRIKEIKIRNLGPIQRFTAELGIFNLIYGHNERGKTYLVEFLIHSIFRNTRSWRLRARLGKGKISVEGLNEKEVVFSPSSEQKIEDFWEKESPGLPPDFSKLLVVKGAEVELAGREVGVDKAVLKHFLTGQELLDTIDNKIPKTIQKAEIKDTVVIGNKQGDIKSREELGEQLKSIKHLFMQIDRGYSGGHRKLLTDEKDKLEKEFDLIEKAKRFLAFYLDSEIKKLERMRERISETKLQETRESLRIYKQRIEDYKQKKQEQIDVEERSRHHEWLSGANEVYQNILKQETGNPKPLFLILSGIMVLAAGGFAVLRMPIWTVVALVGLVLFTLLYLREMVFLAARARENEELKKLEKEFETRFKSELTGFPLIQELLHKTTEDYSRARILKDQLFSDLRTIESLKLKLSDQIVDLTGSKKEPDTWEDTLAQLNTKCRELTDRIQEKKIRLAGLGIDPSDYVEGDPEVAYSKETYDRIHDRLHSTNGQIEEENRKLTTLKQLICQQTNDDISIDWESLIQNLREKREKVAEAYKQKTAEIVGKMMVYRVLESLRKDEDIKVEDGLQAETVLEPLYRMTKRYNGLKIENEKLVVSDSFHDFPLSDLSTGAQEQILLALRIGFVQKLVMSREPLFLILDDAFQYSDWERRVWLMDMIVDLAKAGWQIIYFTMDDHIRGLFEKKGKVFGDRFRIAGLDKM